MLNLWTVLVWAKNSRKRQGTDRVGPGVFMKVDKHKGKQEAGIGHNQVAVLYKQTLREDTGDKPGKV